MVSPNDPNSCNGRNRLVAIVEDDPGIRDLLAKNPRA